MKLSLIEASAIHSLVCLPFNFFFFFIFCSSAHCHIDISIHPSQRTTAISCTNVGEITPLVCAHFQLLYYYHHQPSQHCHHHQPPQHCHHHHTHHHRCHWRWVLMETNCLCVVPRPILLQTNWIQFMQLNNVLQFRSLLVLVGHVTWESCHCD